MRDEKYDWAAYQKKYQERMKIRGLCPSCGKKIEGQRCQQCVAVKQKRSKRLREHRKVNGLCYRCGNPVTEGAFTCEKCLVKNREEVKLRKEKFKENGICPACGKLPARPGMVTCDECGSRCKNRNKELDKIRKDMVMNHYGGRCVCCGEDSQIFLCIDHIKNNGNKHRKEIGRTQSGKAFYYWIIQNDYPDDLQILCFNCNMGKQLNGGICPHQTEGAKP
jgi:hypothetical protein